MHNLICMTWGFSVPFFPSWKSQVASIIYTSLRLFLVSPFSTRLPPSSFSLHLLFSLLAIWSLQLCSLAYCRKCRCHQKLFTFKHFDAVPHIYIRHCRRFAQPLKTEAEGQNLILLIWVGAILYCSILQSYASSPPHSPRLDPPSLQQKGLCHRDGEWLGVASHPSFKLRLNIHAVQGGSECVIFALFKG